MTKKTIQRAIRHLNAQTVIMYFGLVIMIAFPLLTAININYLELKPSSGAAYTLVVLLWGMLVTWSGVTVHHAVQENQVMIKKLKKQYKSAI